MKFAKDNGVYGARMILTSTERTQQRKRLWKEREHICALCFKPIWEFEDMELDHIIPRSRGRRDDRDENQQLTHVMCNRTKSHTYRSFPQLPQD